MHGIQIRWLHASCYEIKLENGKIITFDPYVSPLEFPDFGIDDMLTPDYLFCTHTHFDHIMDIGALMHRNIESTLFIGILGSAPLADHFDLHFGQVHAMHAYQTAICADFKVTTYPGKHSRFKRRSMEKMSFMAGGPDKEHKAAKMEHLMSIGSMEYTDFLITLPGNFRIFFTGGDKNSITQYEAAAREAPNLVIRQASNLDSPEDYAQVVARYGAQYVLPHHHENAAARLGVPMEEFAQRVNRKLSEIAPGMQFINPKQFQWYSFMSALERVGKQNEAEVSW